MDSRQFLSQVFYLNKVIKNLKDYADRLELQATEATQGFSNSGTSITHDDSKGSKIDNLMSKAIDARNEAALKLEELLDIEKDIRNVIFSIGNLQYVNLLVERYLNCKAWKLVADSLGFSVDYAKWLHRKALRMVEVPSKYKDV